MTEWQEPDPLDFEDPVSVGQYPHWGNDELCNPVALQRYQFERKSQFNSPLKLPAIIQARMRHLNPYK